MRAMTHPVTDPGFITLCIQMAQSTFSDVMPSKQYGAGHNTRPTSALANRAGKSRSLISRLDDWFYRQQLNARESYLADSTDIFDLELRIRQLERRPCY